MATVNGYMLEDFVHDEIRYLTEIPNPMQLPNGDLVYGASAGWENETYRLVETSWEVPDPPVPVPEIISDRQFFQSLALSGTITQDEALAAVKTGALPAKLQTAVDGMPPDQKFAAEMLLSGATAFERNHPMTDTMMQMLGWSPTDTDKLWIYAATL